MQLSQEELATVLAGLRLIQRTDALPPDIADIYYEGGRIAKLTHKGIDALCVRLCDEASQPESASC